MNVQLAVRDGTTMHAFVARPDGRGPHSGLLLFQEAYGVNAHIRDVAGRFAGQGYVVIAPELYHRTAPPGFESPYGDFAAIASHLQALTPEQLEHDIAAAYAWLATDANTDRARLTAVGFCMGGRVSFLATTVVSLRAAVSFYGAGIAPALLDRAPRAGAPILFFWGGRDKHISPEQRRAVVDALAAASKPYVTVEFSEADHAFFCDARPSFHPSSAAAAWALTLGFLADRLH